MENFNKLNSKKFDKKNFKRKDVLFISKLCTVDDMTVDQNFKIILKINPEFEDEKKV